MKRVTYKCKENDAVLQFWHGNGKIEEVWVKVDGETSWTVVGFKDLTKAVEKAKKEAEKELKDSHDYGGGYLGENLHRLS